MRERQVYKVHDSPVGDQTQEQTSSQFHAFLHSILLLIIQ